MAKSGRKPTAKKRTAKGTGRSGGKTTGRGGTGRGKRKATKKATRKPSHRMPTMQQRAAAKKARSGKAKPTHTSEDTRQRLQRVLAAAGLGSRRACEELITTGRVDVDGETVTELGTRVDPFEQRIRVDGQLLSRPRRVYLAVNKPKGVVCTNRDPLVRQRVIDLVPERLGRLFPVGRLDMNSEGLILLTNDGELANRITHPRYGLQKIYRVQVAGLVTREKLRELEQGIHLAEGLAKVTDITIKSRHKNSTILEMILDEGKNREIRRVLARVGHKVMSLVRVAVGPVRLGTMASGEYRRLSGAELKALRSAVEMPNER